jgi:integrase
MSDRPVRELTAGDLEVVRDRMLAAYRPSTVHRAVRQGREMLTWAWRYHPAKAGLDPAQHAWWERWSVKYKWKVRHHTPKIEEIARTMVIADMFRHLSDNEHETYPGTVGALWAAALTAQRTGSLLVLRPDRLFVPEKKAKLSGWKIANWTAEEMKGGKDGGRPHAVPVPPEALKVLERYYKASGGKSAWMFSGRKSTERITQSALNLLMYRLQGRVFDHRSKNKPDRPGKPGPKAAKRQRCASICSRTMAFGLGLSMISAARLESFLTTSAWAARHPRSLVISFLETRCPRGSGWLLSRRSTTTRLSASR